MQGKIENLLARANEQTAKASSVASASRLFQTDAEAEKNFLKLRDKVFNIEHWHAESEITGFSLYDANGAAQAGKPAVVGDFIRTSLPASGKDDWVEIVEIFDAAEEIVLTVRPSRDPTAAQASAVSHFFIPGSTNNFCLQKVGAKINFYVIGLNERTNIAETGGIIEAARNLATANIGYFLGVQKTQWKTFCNNFVENGEESGKD